MFDKEKCHVYLIEWHTQSYHRMLIATDTPLTQKRMKSFEREGKKMSYDTKSEFESIDEVISRMNGNDRAYG